MHILTGELRGHGSIWPLGHRERLWPSASTKVPLKQRTPSFLHFYSTGYQLINKTININFFL